MKQKFTKIKFLLLFLVGSLILTGCASQGLPDIDFPLERNHLDALHGTIKNDVYTTIFKGCTFSIDIPQKYNRFEFSGLKAREERRRHSTFISFGPIPADKTIYRVMLIEKGHLSLEEFKDKNFPVLVDVAAKGYDRHMNKIYKDYITVNGRPAIYEVYLQRVAGIYQYIDMRQTGDVTLTHAIYYVDYGKFGVLFWIQASSDSGMYNVNEKNRKEMIHRTWKPQVRFVKSFVFYRCGFCCL